MSDATPTFRKDIEGLRAIAVVSVLLYHAHLPRVTGGFVGVDIFFVISGFLITGQLLRDDQGSYWRGIRRFYARRIRRIVPAATVVIVVTLVGAALLEVPLRRPVAARDAAGAMFFVSNVLFAVRNTNYFDAGTAHSLFQHFWSLSVEEQFYVVWPTLVLAASLTAPAIRRRALGVTVCTVGLVSFLLGLRLTSTNPPYAFFLLPTRAWELCVGAALAVFAGSLRFGATTTRVLRVVGLMAIGVAVFGFSREDTFPGTAALLPVIGCAMVIAAGTPMAAGAGRLLTGRAMQLGGRYSYSLYLWHWPALMLGGLRYPHVLTDWPKAVLVIAFAAVPAAVGSYHLVEHPFRTRLTTRPDRDSLRVGVALVGAGAFVLLPYQAVASVALDAGRATSVRREAIPSNATDFVPSNLQPSLLKASEPVLEGIACAGHTWNCVAGEATSPTIVLFGDSHARQWLNAFATMADRNGWRVETISQRTWSDGHRRGACSSFENKAIADGPGCDAFRTRAFAKIRAIEPDLVVFSNLDAGDFATNTQAWSEAVGDAIDRLPRGVRGAVLAENPLATSSVPECLSSHLHDTRPCEPRPTNANVADANEVMRAVVPAHGATFIDTSAWFCTDTRCPAIMGRTLVYSDSNHLTRTFTLGRVDALTAALGPLMNVVKK